MTLREFFSKLGSKIIWWNIFAMTMVVVAVAIGVWLGLDAYTRHGEEIRVPNVKGMSVNSARRALEEKGLTAVVADSGYNKALPSGTVLEQTPMNDSRVKPGREIYLTINTTRTPTVTLPDIADNSSLREAQARLTAMGLKLSPCEYIDGEKDWVYGVKYKGRNIFKGDRIPIESELTLQVGRGEYGDEELDEFGTDSLTDAADPYDESAADGPRMPDPL